MSCKKIIAILIVFTCISNAVYGMEIVKDLVKNEVIPAAAIVATCAAVSTLSEHLIWKIHGKVPLNHVYLKNNAKVSTLWSLPIVVAALLGSRSSRLEFSLENCIIVGGLASLPYLAMAGLTKRSQKEWEEEYGSLPGCYATYGKIILAHAASCFLVSSAIVAKRMAS